VEHPVGAAEYRFTASARRRLEPYQLGANIMSSYETYAVEIAGLKRNLRLFEIKPGLKIAILNILGDTELVQASAKELAQKLRDIDYDLLVTAEAKSIPLAHALSVETKKPYVVLRKTYKPYMGDALKAETLSITTGQPQTLILDEKDIQLMKGKKVVIVDDVISTGSTLQGMRMVLDKAGASVAGEAAIFTEGDRAQWMHIVSLGHLPLFTE
jgi:adenine phosphoribosyltransferase